MTIDVKDNLASNSLVERNGLVYLVNSETPYTGEAISEHYPSFFYEGEREADGEIITSYKNGLKDGPLTIKNLDGSRRENTYYKKGLKDGFSLTWHPNGQKQSEVNYVNDLKEGREVTWHPNGQKQSEVNYVNDLKEGREVTWHPNGHKQSEVNYVNDLKEGPQLFWDTDGNKSFEDFFKNDIYIKKQNLLSIIFNNYKFIIFILVICYIMFS